MNPQEISTPNEYGVFVDGVEILEFFGKHSKAKIRCVFTREGWRGNFEADFWENPARGISGSPSLHCSPYPTKELCISSVCALMRTFCLTDGNRHPKGQKELLAWLEAQDPARPHQLSLFD